MTSITPFNEFLSSRPDSSGEMLEEALVTLGRKPYPKFNTILVLQGGAGSGKDFILNNLIGLEGKVLDVDHLKQLVVASDVLSSRIKKETGHDLKAMNFKNPEDVSALHRIIGDLYKIDSKYKDTFFQSVATADPQRKPNVIFNVTGKSLKHFAEVRQFAEAYGYDKSNIHTVWVLDDVKASVKKNRERARTVPEDILIETHEGASLTSKKLLSMGKSISKFMDGDYWIVFNKMFVDSEFVQSKNDSSGGVLSSRSSSKGSYIKRANYFKLKAQNDAPLPVNQIKSAILEKIQQYVPDIDSW